MMKKEKGFALVLALLVLVALSTMSIAMLGIIQTNSANSVRSHQVNTVAQTAEFGIDSGRLWLVDQLSKSGNSAIVITNSEKVQISGECLALHGYTDTTERIYYSYRKINQNFASMGTETDFGRYTYELYVQRIGNHSTINGYNFIPQPTQGSDSLSVNSYNDRRIFYRVISCGYGPNGEKIVPLQGYFSAGGDGATGNVARSLNNEGFYRP